ncbi:squalene/phytoene synthase family protein, partial [Staphylococcus capitis]
RIYISKERLAHFNIDIKQQYQQGVTSNYIKMWEALAYIAEQAYHDALSNIHVFNKQAQPIIELAAVIYAGILDEVRKAGYTLHQRVYVS